VMEDRSLPDGKNNLFTVRIGKVQIDIYRSCCAAVQYSELGRSPKAAHRLNNANVFFELDATLFPGQGCRITNCGLQIIFIDRFKQGKIKVIGKAVVFNIYFPDTVPPFSAIVIGLRCARSQLCA